MESLNDISKIIAQYGANKIAQGWDLTEENCSQYRSREVWDLLDHLNISEDDLNSLNIIHVAGSKGKGSTCTFIESILRENGVKTGLFTSPHVRKLTERICVDGQPIGDEKFVKIFQRLWSGDGLSICDQFQLPPYFLVFFCMAIRAFVDEGVEVAIIEVGIGGEYDFTNIISRPVVCAITLLEIEHADLLGKNIESIAWHKSGIFKPGSNAFTIPQKKEAMAVLKQRAKERGCDLEILPELTNLTTKWNKKIEIGLKGKFQYLNALLAIEVCLAWMRKMGRIKSGKEEQEVLPDNTIDNFIAGIKKASMLGRMEIIERPGTTYYIDFAHTQASLQNAADWFEECCTQKEAKMRGKMFRILVLYIVNKDLNKLIPILQKLHFDRVVFPVAHLIGDFSISFNGHDMNRVRQYATDVAETWRILDPSKKDEPIKRFDNINEAVAWIAAGRDEEIYSKAVESLDEIYHDESATATKMDHVQVFVAGSFGLVRGFLSLLSE